MRFKVTALSLLMVFFCSATEAPALYLASVKKGCERHRTALCYCHTPSKRFCSLKDFQKHGHDSHAHHEGLRGRRGASPLPGLSPRSGDSVSEISFSGRESNEVLSFSGFQNPPDLPVFLRISDAAANLAGFAMSVDHPPEGVFPAF